MSKETNTAEELGIDPKTVPGTPQAAAAEALGDPVALQPPIPMVVDVTMRKRVNRSKASGLWCFMGPEFSGCKIRIRPWNSRAIAIFREQYEMQLRARNPKVKKGDDLPGPENIELNRGTAVMSITGFEGAVQIASGNVASFRGDEDPAEVRQFFSQQFLVPYDPEHPDTATEIDMDVLDLLMSLNNGLSKVSYEEIDRLGEDFVYGATEGIDYSDSTR